MAFNVLFTKESKNVNSQPRLVTDEEHNLFRISNVYDYIAQEIRKVSAKGGISYQFYKDNLTEDDIKFLIDKFKKRLYNYQN